MDNTAQLIELLAPPAHKGTLQALLKTGTITAKLGFFNVSFGYGKGQVLGANMPKSIPTLLSEPEGSQVIALARKDMAGLVDELFAELVKNKVQMPNVFVGLDVAAKVAENPEAKVSLGDLLPKKAGVKVPDVKAFTEASQPAGVPLTKAAAYDPAYANINDTPIKLATASKLLQPVKGTSLGVVYYTIALSDNLRLAVRKISSPANRVSFRVEGTATPAEKVKLQEAGMIQSTGYWSMHLECEDVSMARVVGAFLMGLGINFNQQVVKFDDIPGETA